MRVWRTTAALAAGTAAALLVAGCGGGSGRERTTEPTPPPSSAPTRTGGPSITCDPVGGIPGCVDFVSVAGSDATGQLAWLASDPLRFRIQTVDGRPQASFRTPCNPGSGELRADGGALVFGRFAVGAMGCGEPGAGYEHWTWKLIEVPLAYTFDGATLTLGNDRGTVELRKMV